MKKFIINKGRLISWIVKFHRELSNDHSETKGGGEWYLSSDSIYFYGKSEEFGRASEEDVIAGLNKFQPFHIRNLKKYFSTSDSLSEAFRTAKLISDPLKTNA